ncbi:restriction endonuclease subunit S [Lactococcus garvieae]|uniref:restriction endonuclease subunit S n=1 Tax=Lactococcus garvieae TaxID=1363 RepID=UPI0022E93845|nr:restriction endonuclease subunit S [Lactococcus garvieae]
MMSKKRPQLRFEGFTDDWEDRKLSSIAERVTRKNKNNESTLPLTISAQDGLVDQNDYFNKQVASRDVTGYFLVKNGEFAYNKSYSNGYPWGAIKRLDKYEMGVLSTLYIVFKPTAINSQFLVSYYETTRWYREVSKNAAEGARNHGLLNIPPNDFFNTLLTIPKSAEEQQQIGSFFKQLDDTIALHQRKLDLLKEQKKGYLQKMFPKNGGKVPELRFAGFADDWEERKLGEFSDVRDGTHASPKYVSQGHPMVTSKNLTHSGLDMTDVSFLTDEDFNEINKRSKVSIGDILFGMIGTIGNPVIVDRDDFAIKNVALIKEKTSNPITNKWLLQYLKSPSFNRFIQKENAGGTQKFIALGLIRDMKLRVPEFDEQQKIGSFFKKIDETIALHQRKLDLLKEQKKGFLQKMFV